MKIRSAAMWAGPNRRSCSLSGQSVLVHGAAGAVGSMVTRLAREFGACIIGIFHHAAARIDEILRAQIECLLTVVGASDADDIENAVQPTQTGDL